MNEIVNKFFKQPGFIYSGCGPSTKIKQRVQKPKEIRDSKYIYQNKLHKPSFHHDMTYEDFKVFPRRAASDQVLLDKAFNIAKTPKYGG